MVSGKVTIINKLGLHARPAGVFVKEMANFQSNITIINGEKKVNAKLYLPANSLVWTALLLLVATELSEALAHLVNMELM